MKEENNPDRSVLLNLELAAAQVLFSVPKTDLVHELELHSKGRRTATLLIERGQKGLPNVP
jgi:hypothetical protein